MLAHAPLPHCTCDKCRDSELTKQKSHNCTTPSRTPAWTHSECNITNQPQGITSVILRRVITNTGWMGNPFWPHDKSLCAKAAIRQHKSAQLKIQEREIKDNIKHAFFLRDRLKWHTHSPSDKNLTMGIRCEMKYSCLRMWKKIKKSPKGTKTIKWDTHRGERKKRNTDLRYAQRLLLLGRRPENGEISIWIKWKYKMVNWKRSNVRANSKWTRLFIWDHWN